MGDYRNFPYLTMGSMIFLPHPPPPLAYRNSNLLLHVAIPFCPLTSKIDNSLPLMYMYVFSFLLQPSGIPCVKPQQLAAKV